MLLEYALVLGIFFSPILCAKGEKRFSKQDLNFSSLYSLARIANTTLEQSPSFSPEHRFVFNCILESKGTGPCRIFFNLICKSYEETQYNNFKKTTPQFSSRLIDDYFYEFALAHKQNAQEIFDEFIVPEHPFSEELEEKVEIQEFLSTKRSTLSSFFDSAVNKALALKLDQIFASTDQVWAQFDYWILLEKYSRARSWKLSRYKLDCLFLMSVPLDEIKTLMSENQTNHNAHIYIHIVADIIYESIFIETPQRAQEIFKSICPPMHGQTFESYKASIDYCVKNGIQPVNFFIPEQPFIQLISEALQNQRLIDLLSPIYLCIMHAIAENVQSVQAFFHFLRQEYFGKNIESKGTPDFWVQFIESHFSLFAVTHKEQAKRLFEELVIPSHPFFPEIYCLFDFDYFLWKRLSLGHFFSLALEHAFIAKSTEIFKNADLMPDFEYHFHRLLSRYRQCLSWEHAEYKLETVFLRKVDIEYVRVLGLSLLEYDQEFNLYQNLDSFSATVYETMQGQDPSQQQVRDALQAVLPSVFEEHKDKGYIEIMNAYVASGLHPDNEIITPKQFKRLVAEALETPEISSLLSPIDLSILHAFQNEEPMLCDFFAFMYQQNFRLDCKAFESSPHFWYLLTDRHLPTFAHTAMLQAQTIVKNIIVPNHPFSIEMTEFYPQIETLALQSKQAFHKEIEVIVHQIFTR